jgi:hypothetical protein
MHMLSFKYVEIVRYMLVSAATVAMLTPFSTGAKTSSSPEQPAPVDPQTCRKVLELYTLGPAITVAQAEATSLEEMKSTPYAPQVPFGYTNDEWTRLKKLMQNGDTLHRFKTDVTGGYVLVRQGCLVVQLTEWIR